MRKNSVSTPVQVVYPSQGLNTQDPSTFVDPKYTPSATNVDFRRGNVRKRKGYSQLGDTLDGTVMAVIKFEVSSTVIKTVAITTTKEYAWSGTNWDDVTLQMTGVDVDRTGDTNDLVDWVIGTDQNGTWLIISNGKDLPRKWSGSGRFVDSGINLPGLTSVRCLAIYKDSLVIGNLNSDEHKVVAYSDTLNFFEFTTGNADTDLVSDGDGELVRMLPIADQLTLYCQNSIHTVTYIGGDVLYSRVKVVDNTRLLSPRSVMTIGPIHFYMSEENIFLFDGTRQFRPMGRLIQNTYRSDLYLKDARKSHVFYDGIETTGLLAVPLLNGGIEVRTMEVDLLNLYFPEQLRWGLYDLKDDPFCFGYFIRDSSLLWSSPGFGDVPWNQLGVRWNDNSTKQGFPLLIFGSGSVVYIMDGVSSDDNGVAVSASIDTVDFTVPQEYISENGRWTEVEMELKGSSVVVQYSTDQGLTWSNFGGSDVGYTGGVQLLTTEFERYRFFLLVSSKFLRVRISNSEVGGNFERRFFRAWVQPSGAW